MDEITPEYERLEALATQYDWEMDLPPNYPNIRKLNAWRKFKILINTGNLPPTWAKYYSDFAVGYYNIKYSSWKPKLNITKP